MLLLLVAPIPLISPRLLSSPANVLVDLALTTPLPLERFIPTPLLSLDPNTISLLGFSPTMYAPLSLILESPLARL